MMAEDAKARFRNRARELGRCAATRQRHLRHLQFGGAFVRFGTWSRPCGLVLGSLRSASPERHPPSAA